ncbi:MAG: alpha-glucan family phosphorylase [Candidatus Aenigmatarchaeota archaeon]
MTAGLVSKKISANNFKIAYFTMEIGLDSTIPTYAGGLGVLAGDHVLSCADLEVPLFAVTLAHRAGYFKQKLDDYRGQLEEDDTWDPSSKMDLETTISIPLKEEVKVNVWRYNVRGIDGYTIPVFFLDTDVEKNSEEAKRITHRLYQGDPRYRLAQEAVLGIGGYLLIKQLGLNPDIYHLNELHSALLLRQLLKEMKNPHKVREMCKLTIHTPLINPIDSKFDYSLVKSLIPDLPSDIQSFAGDKNLELMKLAVSLSGSINAVSRKQKEILQSSLEVDYITNGVHHIRWCAESFQKLFEEHIPNWRRDPSELAKSKLPDKNVSQAHKHAKAHLLEYIAHYTGREFDPSVFTIGIGRRVTWYKRHNLILKNPERLKEIAKKYGGLQIVFAGKAHPEDPSKSIITDILNTKIEGVEIVFLPNYNIDLAKLMVAGSDVWLNNPLPPNEACGTSGMKAALNGVPHFTTLDGWALEGLQEGINGWVIDGDFYQKLESVILELSKRETEIRKETIATITPYFNSHRMVKEYCERMYGVKLPVTV